MSSGTQGKAGSRWNFSRMLARRPVSTGSWLAWPLSCVLFAIWAAWWSWSVYSGRLRLGGRLWIPANRELGFDFIYCRQASLLWLTGGDPYLGDFGDPEGRVFHYPPICLPFFAWSSLFETDTAVLLWMIVVVAVVALGVWEAARARNALGLGGVHLPLVLALTLLSTPVLFAQDRGNCDVVPLATILLASRLLSGRPSAMRELAAGGLLGLAFAFKIYPGVLVVGLAACRRWRGVGGFVVASLLIWGASPQLAREFLETNARYLKMSEQYTVEFEGEELKVYYLWSHSLSYAWDYADWPGFLGSIRGEWFALLLTAPLLGYVCGQFLRRTVPDALILPLLTWLAALATFVPKISNDYNLVYLPVLAIALLRPREKPYVHWLVLPMIVWLQPVSPVHYQWPPQGGLLLLAIKFLGIIGLGAALLARLRENDPTDQLSCDGLAAEGSGR